MIKTKSILSLTFCLVALSAGAATAGVDLYPLPQIEDGQTQKAKTLKTIDPFTQAMAKKTQVQEEVLKGAVEKGFGRTELLRLILISKKSGRPLPDLIKEREKGARLAKIAADSKQDDKAIRKEAAALLKELETAQKQADGSIKTPVAGTGNRLSKDPGLDASPEKTNGDPLGKH